MNLTKDIKQHLVGCGITETIYRSRLPDDAPDEAVCLYEYAGQPLNQMDSAFAGLSLQVVVRDTDFDAGLQRAQTISSFLRDIGNPDGAAPAMTIGDTLYHKITALQSPFKLKEDERGRIYFAQNFRVWTRSQ